MHKRETTKLLDEAIELFWKHDAVRAAAKKLEQYRSAAKKDLWDGYDAVREEVLAWEIANELAQRA